MQANIRCSREDSVHKGELGTGSSGDLSSMFIFLPDLLLHLRYLYVCVYNGNNTFPPHTMCLIHLDCNKE